MFTDCTGLEHACQNIIRVLSKQSPLHKESALLSRFLYKYDKKFRNDIGYRNIRKINTALKKYLQLNLYKDVDNFIAILPNGDDYYPTRQMLEYVLVRIIAFSKIMLRVCVCSKQAAVFYFDRVKRGESHWMSLVPYALLSRVCSFCTVLLYHATSWYASLYMYLIELQPKGLNFLPPHYELPDDLSKWLDLENMDNFGRFKWSQKKRVNVDMSALDEEEFNTFDNILGFIKNINNDDDENLHTINEFNSLPVLSTNSGVRARDEYLPHFPRLVDQGEAVSRESFLKPLTAKVKESSVDDASRESLSILNNFQKKISESKVSHYFGRVTNLQSLTNFIDKEQDYRNDGDKRSLTCHLSFMQWETLKSSLVKVCDGLSKSRKVEKKIQKVWKEKCLDYID